MVEKIIELGIKPIGLGVFGFELGRLHPLT